MRKLSIRRFPGPTAFRRLGTAFFKDQRGATAVELGILALPFFAIIAAIFQTAVVFLAGQLLDSAVQDASRMIRTGRAQSVDINDFKMNKVCPGLVGIFNCNNLRVSVTTVASFGAATLSPVLDPSDSTKWKLPEAYQPGNGSTVELVQVYYKWPILLRFLGLTLGGPDGTQLLGSVRVFKNEPFT